MADTVLLVLALFGIVGGITAAIIALLMSGHRWGFNTT
ncbi:hypothetical protein Mahau_0146 [Mahella australiensis 50-1 BON]|uniref:Uncharacterized protein n=1 Tax=Mahella australiensis (strain DSM 15567 / CIP 107919 / 50-1 BON) TaxID=697281 RepID=F3ZVZ5_MAHA5|nr:hypothetical protein Mahau_0146 [Mahella australiensis 50-1 BON]